jgi:hypothetical protein
MDIEGESLAQFEEVVPNFAQVESERNGKGA